MKRIFFALLLLMPLVTDVYASGGGGGGGGGGFSGGVGGGGGSRQKKVNTKIYDKGKAVLAGRFTPVSSSRSVRSSQARNLVQLKKKLAKKSEREAAKIDVAKWAGRMSSNDFRSLKYYIDVKFLKSDRYTRR